MNWVLSSNQHAELDEYRLLQHDKCLLSLKYNPLQHSARFMGEGKYHRLFYSEQDAYQLSRTIFSDQYGMETASLMPGKLNSQDGGLAVLDGKKYFFTVQQNVQHARLLVYENNAGQPWFNCDVTSIIDGAVLNFLIIGMGWYFVLQQQKEKWMHTAA